MLSNRFFLKRLAFSAGRQDDVALPVWAAGSCLEYPLLPWPHFAPPPHHKQRCLPGKDQVGEAFLEVSGGEAVSVCTVLGLQLGSHVSKVSQV